MSGELPKRKLPRLSGYDYSRQGMYFLTACTDKKRPLFGTVVGGGVLDAPRMDLAAEGRAVVEQIAAINAHYVSLKIERYIIMPNHVHLLVSLAETPGGPSGTPAPTDAMIPSLMSTLKRLTNKTCGAKLWQRGYHDHIVRDEADYLRVSTYIDENPAKWSEDCYYTEKE